MLKQPLKLTSCWYGAQHTSAQHTPTPAPAQQRSSSSPPPQPYDLRMTALCFLFPALGGALFGYDIGATSGALVSLTDPVLSGTTWFALDPIAQGAVVSCSLFGALAGSLAALVYGDALGRRRELLLAAVCYAVGATTMAVSPSLAMLLGGHALYGIGIGFAMHGAHVCAGVERSVLCVWAPLQHDHAGDVVLGRIVDCHD